MKKLVKFIPKWLRKRLIKRPLLNDYKSKVREAEEMHSQGYGRVYIVYDTSGSMIVMTKEDFKMLRRKRVVPDKMTITQMKNSSLYYTADEYDRDPMTPEDMEIRLKAYFAWFFENVFR